MCIYRIGMLECKWHLLLTVLLEFFFLNIFHLSPVRIAFVGLYPGTVSKASVCRRIQMLLPLTYLSSVQSSLSLGLL